MDVATTSAMGDAKGAQRLPSLTQVINLQIGHNAMCAAKDAAAWYASGKVARDVLWSAAGNAVWDAARNIARDADDGAARDADERGLFNEIDHAAVAAALDLVFRNEKNIFAVQKKLKGWHIVRSDSLTIAQITEDLFSVYNDEEARKKAHPLAIALYQLVIYHVVTGRPFDPAKTLMQHYMGMYAEHKRNFFEFVMFAATKANRAQDTAYALAANKILDIRALGFVKEYLASTAFTRLDNPDNPDGPKRHLICPPKELGLIPVEDVADPRCVIL